MLAVPSEFLVTLYSSSLLPSAQLLVESGSATIHPVPDWSDCLAGSGVEAIVMSSLRRLDDLPVLNELCAGHVPIGAGPGLLIQATSDPSNTAKFRYLLTPIIQKSVVFPSFG